MGTLTDQIRRLTGVTSVEVSDVDVRAALDEHREWNHLAPCYLDLDVLSVAKRGNFDAWGQFEPCTSTTVTLPTVLVNSLGAAPAGTWVLDADGSIAFAVDQAFTATLYLSAYSYDVNAAAVEVIDQFLGVLARDYDVKLGGDQEFKRSQAVAAFERKRDKLAAGRLARSVQRMRNDEAVVTHRVESRLRRRAERE